MGKGSYGTSCHRSLLSIALLGSPAAAVLHTELGVTALLLPHVKMGENGAVEHVNKVCVCVFMCTFSPVTHVAQ